MNYNSTEAIQGWVVCQGPADPTGEPVGSCWSRKQSTMDYLSHSWIIYSKCMYFIHKIAFVFKCFVTLVASAMFVLVSTDQSQLSFQITLPTESVFGVRMLHMLTDSAMSASGVQIEGTTFVRVKILDYHYMLPFLLPIHLYKHQNMIYLWNSSCTFLNCITTYCLRRVWFCMDSLWRLTFWTESLTVILTPWNRFIYVAHFQCQTMFRITFTGLNYHMYLLWISEL